MRTVAALRTFLGLPEHRWSAAMHALYASYWQAGADIANPAVIAAALTAAGVPADEQDAAVASADTDERKADLRRRTDEAVALGIFQRPGSNALSTSDGIKAKMEELKKLFPPGIDYTVVYNPTEFIQASVDAVIHTLFEALILVVVVVILFLQTWRAALIPLLAIPVSLIGSFAVMSAVAAGWIRL
jgi:Cu/Ag efflux pump CusA